MIADYTVPPVQDRSASLVAKLPPVALNVLGVTYDMGGNSQKTNNVRLVFDPAKPNAELSYMARTLVPDFQIGLDGVPRSTATNDSVFVATG